MPNIFCKNEKCKSKEWKRNKEGNIFRNKIFDRDLVSLQGWSSLEEVKKYRYTEKAQK